MTNCCIKKKCSRKCDDCNRSRSPCKSCKSKSSSYFCKPKCCSEHKRRKKKSNKCKCKSSKCESTKCKQRTRRCDKIAVVQIDKSNCGVQNDLAFEQFDLGGHRAGRSVYFSKYRRKQLEALEQDCERKETYSEAKCIDKEVETDDTLHSISKKFPGAKVFFRRGSSRSQYTYKRPQCCKPEPKIKKTKKKKDKKEEKCYSKKRCDRYITLSRYYKGQFRPYCDPSPKCGTDSGISLKPKSSAFCKVRSEPREIKYKTASQEVDGENLSPPARSTSSPTNFRNQYNENCSNESSNSSEDAHCENPGRSRGGSDARKQRFLHSQSQATVIQRRSQRDPYQPRSTSNRRRQIPESSSEESVNSFKQCRTSTQDVPSKVSVTFQSSRIPATKNPKVLAVDVGNKKKSISTDGINRRNRLMSIKQDGRSKYFKKYCLFRKKMGSLMRKRGSKAKNRKRIDCEIQASYKTVETCSSAPQISTLNGNKPHNRVRCCKPKRCDDMKIILSDSSLHQARPRESSDQELICKDLRGLKVHISKGKYRPNVGLESDQFSESESSANFYSHRRITYDPQILNTKRQKDFGRIRAGSSERRFAGLNKYYEDPRTNKESGRRHKSKNRRFQEYYPEEDEYSTRFRKMERYDRDDSETSVIIQTRKPKPRRRAEDEDEESYRRSYSRSYRSEAGRDREDEERRRKPYRKRTRYNPGRRHHQENELDESDIDSRDRYVIDRNERISSEGENRRVKISSQYSTDSTLELRQRSSGTCPYKKKLDKHIYVSGPSKLRKKNEECQSSKYKKRIHKEEGLPVTIIVSPYVKNCRRNPHCMISTENCRGINPIRCSQKKCRSCGKPVMCGGLPPPTNIQKCGSKKEKIKKTQKGALYTAGSTDIIINRSDSSIDIYRIESEESTQWEASKYHRNKPTEDNYDVNRKRDPYHRDIYDDEVQHLGKSRYFSKKGKHNPAEVMDSRTKYTKTKCCKPKRTKNDCRYDGTYNRNYHIGFSSCSHNDQPICSKHSILMCSSSLNSLTEELKRNKCTDHENNKYKPQRCSIINDPIRREKKRRSRYLDNNSKAGTHYQHSVKNNCNIDVEKSDCKIPPQTGHCPERQEAPKSYWNSKMQDMSRGVASVSNSARKITNWDPEPKLVKYWCECCETFVRPKKKVKRTLFTECVANVLQCCVPQLKVHVTVYVCPKCQNTLIKFIPENKSAVKGCINKNFN